MDFGWKKKAEKLRMVILSGAHQLAKELPPGLARILAVFAHVAKTGDGSMLQTQLASIPPDEAKPLWEPAEIYGWSIQVTMYLENGQLWWLAHAERRNGNVPSDKEMSFLDKVLEHLGADPARDAIIAPRSSPPGEPPLPFGWWAWFNRQNLYEIQVNKQKKGQDAIRIVPLGTRGTAGYQSLDALDGKHRE